MSLIEMGKELLNGMDEASRKKHLVVKVSKVIRIMAALILVCVYMNNELNFGITLPKISLNLWDESVRAFIKDNIYKVSIFWLVYDMIISNFLRWLCVRMDKTEEVKSFPVLFTVDDLIDFGCALYLGLYAINQIIELNNAIIVYDKTMCMVAGIYLLIVFVCWVYFQNSNLWYHINREYTYYYDTNNKRIPKDANVIYRGKLYKVIWTGNVAGGKSDTKKEWVLLAWGDRERVSMEEVVKDKDGKLTLATWRIGEEI